MWSTSAIGTAGAMTRFTLRDNDLAEILWLRYGGDPRLVDGLRNHAGSPSVKFVEAYTHWIDCPYDQIAPTIHWARRTLHRHHFEWGGQCDRWLLWFKTAEALEEFDLRPECGLTAGPIPAGDCGRSEYLRHLRESMSIPPAHA